MITKIKLKNWKSHLDSEMEFTKGVNALIGINGSGKSSVLDAITFGFFGTFPNHNNRKIGLDDIIMSRPAAKDEAEIYLEFVCNQKLYSVLRKIKKGKGTILAEIREDGKLIEVNPSSVTEHIERILEIDYPLFSKAVYSDQNNIDYFLTLPKGKRMEQIDKMLKLDRIDEVRNSAGSLKALFENRLNERMRFLSELKKENIEGKLSECQSNIQGFQEKILVFQKELDVKQENKNSLFKIFSDMELKSNRFIEASSRLEGFQRSYSELLDNIKEKSASLFGVTKPDLIKNIEGIKNEKSVSETDLKDRKESLESLRNTIAKFNAEIRSISESLIDFENISAQCPVCESEIDTLKKDSLKEIRQGKIAEIKKNQEESISQISKLREEIESLEKIVREGEKSIDKFTYKLDDFETLERLNNKSKILEIEIERFAKEKSELEKGMANIDRQKVREEMFELNRKIGEISSDIKGLEISLRREKTILEDLKTRLGNIKRHEKDVENYGKLSNFLDNFIKALRLTQGQLREEFTRVVNSIMSNIWVSLYPYGDFSDIRLAVKDGDYVLEIKNIENWINVDGFASGGERSLACLALRVAFSLAFIPNLKWLMLDEPTHNLDSNSIEKFSSVLDEVMGNFVNQVFLITHEPKIAENLEGPVYRLERDKNVGSYTKIVKI